MKNAITRRTAIKDTSAVPLATIPFIPFESKAAEGPIFSGTAPWTQDGDNEAHNAVLETAFKNQISLDLLVNITKHLQEDIVLHICKQIAEFHSSLPEDHAVLLRRKYLKHKPIIECLREEAEFISEPSSPEDIEFRARRNEGLAKNLELEKAIMESHPRSIEGIACVVRTFAECEWEEPDNNRLLSFAERLEGMRVLS